MVQLDAIMDALGEAFPWGLAGDDPLSGMLIGSRGAPVSRVQCSVELTSEIVTKALAEVFDTLVVHNPHLLGSFSWNADVPAGRISAQAVRGGLNVVACHLNAEVAPGGTSDLMARRIGLTDARPLAPSRDAGLVKVVVFVPDDALEAVFGAMADAGAGALGEYTHAGFRVRGTGTFFPQENSHPYSGQAGRLNSVEETRLEMVCPSFRVDRVVDAMLKQHPYEEPAFDIYRSESSVPWGRGRAGDMAQAMELSRLHRDLADWCSSEDACIVGDPTAVVRRVAVAPGAGDGLIEAARRQGAEVFVTGELGWDASTVAAESEMAVITLGSVDSRRALVPAMVDVLRTAGAEEGWDIEVQGYKDREGRWG